MRTISKFLSIVALVGGVGGALASQGQQSPCQTEGTRGYTKTVGAPDPTSTPDDEISNGNLQNAGQFAVNFTCNASQQECHWVYDPSSSEADPNGWIQCRGDLEEL